MKHKAVGIHVFAGGFTVGVQRVFDVAHQLELHGFGLETAATMCGIEPINCESWEDWPNVPAVFAYGNPRCTGFSLLNSGCGSSARGPWSGPTKDIHDFSKYVIKQEYPIAIWESVQEAYSVGRPLLDYLRDEMFVPAGYRIAHLFINASSFGNAQNRRRYFFVAYKGNKNFNIVPPAIDGWYNLVYHVLHDRMDRECREVKLHRKDAEYDEDCYTSLTKEEWECLRYLPGGWGPNVMGQYLYDGLPPKWQTAWDLRNSSEPFSRHCIHRLQWLRPYPTIHSSAGRCIHPLLHRPVTVGEIARAMGWPRIPVGPNPIAQIAKGIVPDVGEWLAQQAERYLDDQWGGEDWESSFDQHKAEWIGGDTPGAVEKVFDLTRYRGFKPAEPDHVLKSHGFAVVRDLMRRDGRKVPTLPRRQYD